MDAARSGEVQAHLKADVQAAGAQRGAGLVAVGGNVLDDAAVLMEVGFVMNDVVTLNQAGSFSPHAW